MGQVQNDIAIATYGNRKVIQDVSQVVLKLNFGNRFRGILKSHGIDFQNF